MHRLPVRMAGQNKSNTYNRDSIETRPECSTQIFLDVCPHWPAREKRHSLLKAFYGFDGVTSKE